MSDSGATRSHFREALRDLVPYEPGRPIEDVQRELGLSRVIKLASNEGCFPPTAAALRALERGATDLNRYPDSGAHRLCEALAERHGVGIEQVAVGAGADAFIMYISLALVDPGDEVVCGWPSFPSYVLDAKKLGGIARTVALRDERYDLPALLAAVNERTRIVYLCNPNNPTGTMVSRAEVEDYFRHVPQHVLTVLDEAYFEYVQEDDYPDGIAESVLAGRRVLVLRTFSKIYGLAGLRVGYGVGPADVIAAIHKVQNAFDVAQPAQDAALVSLDDVDEIERRRAITAEGRAVLHDLLVEHGFRVAPPVANFVYADVGDDAGVLGDRLLRGGVIVRPLAPFGAPNALRITVGTPEELAFLRGALTRCIGPDR
ncbi:MAG: histidinol-phosphate transaminase [Actinomycetia bacterium]|nr:histidinol-phosphate transaminase [Actinomycetes bacterium]